MGIVFPLFVRTKDSGEIAKFESLDEMQRELEAIDVENAEYEAWDRNGMPLNLAVQRPIWLKCEPSSSAARPGELRQAIINYATISDVQLGAEESTSLECEALFRRVAEEHARR